MTRFLTESEIDDILSFIVPNEHLPHEIAENIALRHKERFTKQLKTKQVPLRIIDRLKKELQKIYNDSLIDAGESVGIICAQSIGEKNTQNTLNSIDWTEKILYTTPTNEVVVEPIGQMIDTMLSKSSSDISFIEENRTEYLELKDKYYIPTTDKDGFVSWKRIEAITRHLPVGKLVRVITASGRSIMATQSKSFLVWNGNFFQDVYGSDVRVGDILPTTCKLSKPLLNTTIYIQNILLDGNFGFLVGLYVSIGAIYTKWFSKNYIAINTNVESIRQRVARFCKINKIQTSSWEKVYKIYSPVLINILKTACGVNSDKRVPFFAYTAPIEFIKGFIDGVFSSSGSACKINKSLLINSNSENIITGLAFLLTYFGIFSVIRCVYSISDTKYISHNLRIGSIYSQLFIQNIPITSMEKQLVCKSMYQYTQINTQIPERDVFFDKVVSIEYVDGTTDYVYDLTVEDTRNFQLWNGINCRDTFHKAGLAEKTVTSGVPRLQEIINATRAQKIINHKIYFKQEPLSIESAREIAGKDIVGITLGDLIEETDIISERREKPWYSSYEILYGTRFREFMDNCISLTLRKDKLYMFKITPSLIAKKIEETFVDYYCVVSPLNMQKVIIDVFVDISRIDLPDERVAYINNENMIEICMEEVVQKTLEEFQITGINGIDEIFYTKGENNTWYCETTAHIAKKADTFLDLLALPQVNSSRTLSNNIWDIYTVFGVEAARQYLITEFAEIMDGINICHPMLLADRMTFLGSIESITRYTMRAQETEPLCKASFEETMDNFRNAAFFGEQEEVKGIAASLICGKRPSLGTGFFSVNVDLDELPSEDEDEDQMYFPDEE